MIRAILPRPLAEEVHARAQVVGATLAALRAIVHALRAWPTPYAAVVNTAGPAFDAGPNGADPMVQQQLELVASQVMEFARMRRALASA